ncbi:hypothetical protein TNCV_2641501 [Trichonephila clavipes]|nr:hypothetical protein TNCV_2641501 [Trichonephila clavipes]
MTTMPSIGNSSNEVETTQIIALTVLYRCPLPGAFVLLPGASDLEPRVLETSTAGSDVVQSGRPIFDDFFQHLWPYIGNNTTNVVFQMVKRLWLIRIDQ